MAKKSIPSANTQAFRKVIRDACWSQTGAVENWIMFIRTDWLSNYPMPGEPDFDDGAHVAAMREAIDIERGRLAEDCESALGRTLRGAEVTELEMVYGAVLQFISERNPLVREACRNRLQTIGPRLVYSRD